MLYEPNGPVPQIDFTEGLYIDYRHFDKENIEPRFEFGFGMSYTTFEYRNLRIEALSSKPSSAVPASSRTSSPPMCGTTSLNPLDYTFPATISSLTNYIYPYLAPSMTVTTSLATPTVAIHPVSPSPEGGDPSLWDVVYRVTATIKNAGHVAGQEVAQLYLNLEIDEPIRQLRGDNKTMVQPGQSKEVTFELRRRDVSIWDVVSQQWKEVSKLSTTIGVHVGSSSRDLRLHGKISP